MIDNDGKADYDVPREKNIRFWPSLQLERKAVELIHGSAKSNRENQPQNDDLPGNHVKTAVIQPKSPGRNEVKNSIELLSSATTSFTPDRHPSKTEGMRTGDLGA
jgi:hypothetical protein